ncbi:hypothetical protein [Paenibacillus lautus]|uniref:hypothetical protein n=1 Tax=Paenibacillus lautus TaxID=1401 RepID=UPI0039864ED6
MPERRTKQYLPFLDNLYQIENIIFGFGPISVCTVLSMGIPADAAHEAATKNHTVPGVVFLVRLAH